MKRQIPNMITLCNLACGVLSVLAALYYGFPRQAALLICLGILFDFFDGMTARLLGVSSPMGKELDSLADVVTSGVAPAAILFSILYKPLSENGQLWLAVALLLIPLFAAYRLAKFNLDTRQSHSFLGLPVPSQALVWVGVALSQLPVVSGQWSLIVIVALSLVLSVLMVTELPLFSLKFNFKDLTWRTNSVQYIFLIVCAVIIVALRDWIAISVIILWYIILSAITQRKHAE
ncbi:MAG: CDP-diacylglycerol--serine O-phosphatidyltransferase [Bacteroidales bacterium]|nr:CDP-diacylglycerol--serine O-phosphatidyltransferase [Bacteroidales bacterium]